MEMSKRFDLQVETVELGVINESVKQGATYQVEVLKKQGSIFGNALGFIRLGVTTMCVSLLVA
jgi:hypothetical protein